MDLYQLRAVNEGMKNELKRLNKMYGNGNIEKLKEMLELFQEGHKKGYSEGYKDGYEDGYDLGFSNGTCEFIETSSQDGEVSGMNENIIETCIS